MIIRVVTYHAQPGKDAEAWLDASKPVSEQVLEVLAIG